MKRAAAKIVQKLLTYEQKQRRMDIVLEMLTTFNDDPELLKKVITCDELFKTLQPNTNHPNGSVQKSQDR